MGRQDVSDSEHSSGIPRNEQTRPHQAYVEDYDDRDEYENTDDYGDEYRSYSDKFDSDRMSLRDFEDDFGEEYKDNNKVDANDDHRGYFDDGFGDGYARLRHQQEAGSSHEVFGRQHALRKAERQRLNQDREGLLRQHEARSREINRTRELINNELENLDREQEVRRRVEDRIEHNRRLEMERSPMRHISRYPERFPVRYRRFRVEPIGPFGIRYRRATRSMERSPIRSRYFERSPVRYRQSPKQYRRSSVESSELPPTRYRRVTRSIERSPVRHVEQTPPQSTPSEDGYYSDWEGNVGVTRPSRLFKKVEERGLSLNVPMKKNNMVSGEARATEEDTAFKAEALAWTGQHESPTQDWSAKLQVIHASEFWPNETGQGKITLICADGPPKEDADSSSVQMRWLHVKRSALDHKVLQKLVQNCPFISNDIMAVALALLENVKDKFMHESKSGGYVEPGFVLRSIGTYPQETYDSTENMEKDPVYFLASPYLKLQSTASHVTTGDGEYRSQTLLQSLYGFDVSVERERTQVVRKMSANNSRDDILHVGQLWCLLIGSKVLITFADQSEQDIWGEPITIHPRTSGRAEPVTIQLVDEGRRRYRIIVKPDYTYVDFLRHAVAVVRGNATDVFEYQLLDSDNEILTPNRWTQILQSRKSQLHIFYLKSKDEKLRMNEALFLENPVPSGEMRRPGYSGPMVLWRGEVERTERAMEPRLRSSDANEKRVHLPSDQSGDGVLTNVAQTDGRQSMKYPLGKETDKSLSEEEPGKGISCLLGGLDPGAYDPPHDLDKEPGKLAQEGRTHNTQLVLRERHINASPAQAASRRALEVTPEQYSLAEGWDKYLRNERTGRDHAMHPSLQKVPRPLPPLPRLKSSKNAGEGTRGTSTLGTRFHQEPGALVLRNRRIEDTVPRAISPDRDQWGKPIVISDSIPFHARRKEVPFHGMPADGTGTRDGVVCRPRIRSRERLRHVSVEGRVQGGSSSRMLTRISRSASRQRNRDRDYFWTTQDDEYRERGLVINDDSTPIGRGPRVFDLEDLLDTQEETINDIDQILEISDSDRSPSPTHMGNCRNRFDQANLVNTQRRHSDHYDSNGSDSNTSHAGGSTHPEPVKHRGARFNSTREPSPMQNGQSPPSGCTVRSTENIGPEMAKIPFFTWRLGNETGERLPQDVDDAVEKLLNQLDKSLSAPTVGKLYSRTLKYTMQDLFLRHDFLTKLPTDEDTRAGQDDPATGVGQKSGEGNTTEEVMTPDRTVINNSNLSLEGAAQMPSGSAQLHESFKMDPKLTNTTPSAEPGLTNWGRPQSVLMTGHDKVLMKELLEVSQDILGAFIPMEGRLGNHNICIRFWGSVDTIFRQLAWEEADRGPANQYEYIIRKCYVQHSVLIDQSLPVTSSQKKSWLSCLHCRMRRRYSSATEALEHLHKEHPECAAKTERPYDDPCFVWLNCERMTGQKVQTPGVGMLGFVEDFIQSLLPISRSAKEMHSLLSDAWRGHTDGNETQRPPLPRNLVYAFREIMSMYVFQSQLLSFLNRSWSQPNNKVTTGGQTGHIRHIIDKLAMLNNEAKQKAEDFLDNAKKDIIILGNTTRNIDSLGLEAVGPEFLTLALVCIGQNIQPQAHPPSRSSQEPTFIKLYKDYSSRLHFQANRRPQKRIFLDIYALEEELDALDKLGSSQDALISDFLTVISPDSFRITDTTRIGQHQIEMSYATMHLRELRARNREIGILKTRSKSLKEQVKQIIEIMEEDHGKAIRVFTIVTLFFLPLSFVSSFMGMNTADVRDMDHTQRIFWITGIPVTIMVLSLAFIYAYKGDTINDWMSRNLRDRKRNPWAFWGFRKRSGGGGGGVGDPGRTWTFNSLIMTTDDKQKAFHVERNQLTMRHVEAHVLGRHGKQQKHGQKDLPAWLKTAREKLPGWRRNRRTPTQAGVQRRATSDSLA